MVIKKQFILFVYLISLIFTPITAYSFPKIGDRFYEGDMLYEVTGYNDNAYGCGYACLVKGTKATGDIVIPEQIVHDELVCTVTSIGLYYYANDQEQGAFYNCTELTSVSLPASIDRIENYAFKGCSSLEQINIPDNVVYIGNQTFNGCDVLAKISIPNPDATVGEYAFGGCRNLSAIILPANMKRIESGTFAGCWNLKSINIPESVEFIGAQSFAGSGLLSINIPNSVNSIPYWCFLECRGLASIKLPDSLSIIESGAFNGSGLESIEFPESLKTIGGASFYNCDKLTKVDIPAGVLNIGIRPFSSSDKLTAISVDDGNPNYKSVGGVLFTKNQNLTKLVCYPAGDESMHYKLPEYIDSIGDGAFEEAKHLREVTIPSSTVFIGECAFDGTELESVYCLGEKPAELGYEPFISKDRSHAVLYVPVGSVEAYRNSAWNDYFDDIRENGAGIQDISNESNSSQSNAMYDLKGTRIDDITDLTPGIYIKKEGDKSVKVMIQRRLP